MLGDRQSNNTAENLDKLIVHARQVVK